MANSCEVVRIRVKSASHRCEDIEISCQVGSSVRDVKEIIKDQYPLHPVRKTCLMSMLYSSNMTVSYHVCDAALGDQGAADYLCRPFIRR